MLLLNSFESFSFNLIIYVLLDIRLILNISLAVLPGSLMKSTMAAECRIYGGLVIFIRECRISAVKSPELCRIQHFAAFFLFACLFCSLDS